MVKLSSAVKYIHITPNPDFKQSGKRNRLKILREKEKMLLSNIFSFPHRFLPIQKKTQIMFLSYIFLSSANAINLDLSKILLFDKELQVMNGFILAMICKK